MAVIETKQLIDEYFDEQVRQGKDVRKSKNQLDRPEVYAYEQKIGKQLVEFDADEILEMISTFQNKKNKFAYAEEGPKMSANSYKRYVSGYKQIFLFYVKHHELVRSPYDDPKLKGINKKMLQDASEYKSTADCCKMFGLSPYQIYKLCRNGLVEAKQSAGNRWIVKVESLEKYLLKNRPKVKHSDNGLSVFGGLYSDFNVNWKPILSRNNDHEIFYEDRYELDSQYWISDDGTVFNCNTGHITAPDIDSDKYARVILMKNGSTMCEYVHRLVAYHFCPNRAYKDEVHHIDGKRGNNNAKNLVWVTKQEHQTCHSLMKKSKRDYRKYIKQLKKANQW